MSDTPFHIVRSQAIRGNALVQTVQRIRDTCRKNDFVSRTHREIHVAPLRVHGLPSLDAYQRVLNVTLRSESGDSSKRSNFLLMTKKSHDLSERHGWTTWYACESASAIENSKQDLSISAGLRKEGYFAGVYIHRPSPAVDDLLLRAALFQHVITEIGLSDKIRVLMDGEVLRIKAQEPWKLVYPSAMSDGGNPSGFYVSGFADIYEAISVGERLVDRFARRVLGVSFVAKLTGESYNSIFRALNALWSLWDMDVMGAFTPEAVNILKGGELSNTSPSRIPAFEWYGTKDWAAYGSIVIDNGQRYLEIATDGGTLEILQDRIAFLDDIIFEPI